MTVAIYVRVSTQEQAQEGYSIGEQTERLRKYCEIKDWSVFRVYTDAGYSGSSTDRPGLQQLIKDIEKFNAVLVYKLDRLSRSQLDTLYLIERVFLANNVDFISLSENFDTSTPFGRAMIGILAVFAQLEREQIRERMQMGKEARAKEGKFMGSWNVPVGYDYSDGQLTVNEYEAFQVREVFRLYLQGTGVKTIQKMFLQSGYSHKHGTWNDKTIRNVMRSKVYLGYIQHKGEWFPGTHEPIISEEDYEKAQVLLDASKKRFKENHREGMVKSYFGGLLVCARCGAKYEKVTSKGHHYYYCNSRSKRSPHMVKDPNCRNKCWKMEELDELIFDQIRQLATDPDYEPTVPNTDEKRNALMLEISKLDSALSKLIDLYSIGGIQLETLQKKIEQTQEQKNNLQHDLNILNDTVHDSLSFDEAKGISFTFADALSCGDSAKIRQLILALINHVELDGDNIDIYWNFS